MMGVLFSKKYDVVILCFLKPRKNEFQDTAATVEELSVTDKIVSNIYLSVYTEIRDELKSRGFTK